MKINDRKIFVTGGNKLNGEVCVNGSKNSSLVCMVGACLATNGSTIILENVPDISDVKIMIDIIRLIGKDVKINNNKIYISGDIKKANIPVELTKELRGSTYFLGLLIGVLGEVSVGLPGGDKLGNRPIDIHLEALQSMGMEYKIENGIVYGHVPNKKLNGQNIYLRFPSVGATCNIMIAASKAEGKTIIYNAAREPEIVDLANLLSKMGVKVIGAGTDTVTIVGCDKFNHGQIIHEIIPDRIEAGVLMIATSITGGEVLIKNSTPHHNYPLLSILSRVGVKIIVEGTDIYLKSNGKNKAVRVTTMPFPGVATDLQPLLTVLALNSFGNSMITDLVFPKRFTYVSELRKMGAIINLEGNTVTIKDKVKLIGTKVEGTDIRAVTALICAGLNAEGVTEVSGIYHLRRGYVDLCGQLNKLGANIQIK